MRGLEAALGGLRAAAGELAEALGGGEAEALERALERRRLAFAALERCAGARPSPAAEDALRDLLRLDAAVLARAREQLAAVGRELSELRRLRARVRGLADGGAPARFLSERA